MQEAKYLGTCDKFRRTPQGEQFWQEMMRTKKEIAESTFRKVCDVMRLLDEDETWEGFKRYCAMQGDPIRYYKSENGAYFLQTAGFEEIWKVEVLKKPKVKKVNSDVDYWYKKIANGGVAYLTPKQIKLVEQYALQLNDVDFLNTCCTTDSMGDGTYKCYLER